MSDGQTNGNPSTGEVYRAVTALDKKLDRALDEIAKSRTEAREGHERLRNDLTLQALASKENEVRISMAEDRLKTLDNRIDGCHDRIDTVEASPSKDPAARFAAFGSALGGIIYGAIAWFHKP